MVHFSNTIGRCAFSTVLTITFLFHYSGKYTRPNLLIITWDQWVPWSSEKMHYLATFSAVFNKIHCWLFLPSLDNRIRNLVSNYVDSPVHDSFIHKHPLFAFAVIISLDSRARASSSDALSFREHYSMPALWYYHV